MRKVNLYIKSYEDVGEWVGVSDVVVGSDGWVFDGVNCFSVECSGGRLWLSCFHCFDDGSRDLLRRSIVGSSWSDLLEGVEEYGFELALVDSGERVLF